MLHKCAGDVVVLLERTQRRPMNAEIVRWLEASGGWIDREQVDRVFSVFQLTNVTAGFPVSASKKAH